mmetsp:Transcript_27023/g.68563  ORF Transcript_27023/g.68563 Transcript_27023/m.68563 type:complete len:468 (-) Transcript_27023:595-1998(-)
MLDHHRHPHPLDGGQVGEVEEETVGGEANQRAVGEYGRRRDDVEDGPPRADVRARLVLRPLRRLEELVGVGPDLDAVVEERERGGQGKSCCKERDVPKLYHHFLVFLKHAVVGLHLALLLLLAHRSNHGPLAHLPPHLPLLGPLAVLRLEHGAPHFDGLHHRHLNSKHAGKRDCELRHAVPLRAVHVYAVDGDVVLHEGDEEAREVGVDKLEAEVLCDGGVLILGGCPPVLKGGQPAQHHLVDPVEQHDGERLHHPADALGDGRDAQGLKRLHEPILERRDGRHHEDDGGDEGAHDDGRHTEGYGAPGGVGEKLHLVLVLAVCLARVGVLDELFALLLCFFVCLGVPLVLVCELEPLPTRGEDNAPYRGEAAVEGDPRVVHAAGGVVAPRLRDGEDEAAERGDPQHGSVVSEPRKVEGNLFAKVLPNVLDGLLVPPRPHPLPRELLPLALVVHPEEGPHLSVLYELI